MSVWYAQLVDITTAWQAQDMTSIGGGPGFDPRPAVPVLTSLPGLHSALSPTVVMVANDGVIGYDNILLNQFVPVPAFSNLASVKSKQASTFVDAPIFVKYLSSMVRVASEDTVLFNIDPNSVVLDAVISVTISGIVFSHTVLISDDVASVGTALAAQCIQKGYRAVGTELGFMLAGLLGMLSPVPAELTSVTLGPVFKVRIGGQFIPG